MLRLQMNNIYDGGWSGYPRYVAGDDLPPMQMWECDLD